MLYYPYGENKNRAQSVFGRVVDYRMAFHDWVFEPFVLAGRIGDFDLALLSRRGSGDCALNVRAGSRNTKCRALGEL